jgi:hypothetical protein
MPKVILIKQDEEKEFFFPLTSFAHIYVRNNLRNKSKFSSLKYIIAKCSALCKINKLSVRITKSVEMKIEI